MLKDREEKAQQALSAWRSTCLLLLTVMNTHRTHEHVQTLLTWQKKRASFHGQEAAADMRSAVK